MHSIREKKKRRSRAESVGRRVSLRTVGKFVSSVVTHTHSHTQSSRSECSAPEKIYLYNCPRGSVVPVFNINDCVINWICTVLANHHPINNVYVLIIKPMVYTIHIDKTHTLRQNEHTHAHAQNVYPTLLQSMFSCAFMFISVQIHTRIEYI